MRARMRSLPPQASPHVFMYDTFGLTRLKRQHKRKSASAKISYRRGKSNQLKV